MAEELDQKKSKDHSGSTVIGIIGGILVCTIEFFIPRKDYEEINKNLLLAVPLLSSWISNIVIFIWSHKKPQSADKILLRRTIEKKRDEINKALSNQNIDNETKEKLKKMLGELTIDSINSHEYK